ncbi:MAG: hypothetical protein D6732_12300, partial [Methanobacteriota archaeon]
MKMKYFISLSILLGLGIYITITYQKALRPYISIEEAKKSGKSSQIKGVWVKGTDLYDFKEGVFQFKLCDKSGDTVLVVSSYPKPPNFEQAKELVVIGQYQNGVFNAQKILVKCPSKYLEDSDPLKD